MAYRRLFAVCHFQLYFYVMLKTVLILIVRDFRKPLHSANKQAAFPLNNPAFISIKDRLSPHGLFVENV